MSLKCSSAEFSSEKVKGVTYWYRPWRAPDLLAVVSMSMPMVMGEGKPWELDRMSVVMPLSEGHVLGRPQAAQDALLPMVDGELVPDGRFTGPSHHIADAVEPARTSIVAAHLDVVYHSFLDSYASERKQQVINCISSCIWPTHYHRAETGSSIEVDKALSGVEVAVEGVSVL